MSRLTRLAVLTGVATALLITVPADSAAQGRRVGGRPPAPPVVRAVPVPAVRGHVVFIGGYYYDPFFGPYPWWPRSEYPYWYFPVYATRAEVKLKATPDEAAVYVDGFYAGVVDDFDGVFQALPLPPGGHEITLYLEGYRPVRWNVYLRPGSTLKLEHALERLPPGEVSEPPTVAPPVPPPPSGSYRLPPTPQRAGVATPAAPVHAVGFGTIALQVRPVTAEVTIDGERWLSADDGQFTIQASVGTHHVEVFAPGYHRFEAEIQLQEGQTKTIDVLLSPITR